MTVGIAGGGVAILVIAGFVASSLLGGPDPALVAAESTAPSPSSTAGPAGTAAAEASPSADASPTPTPMPTRAVRLEGGEWATVTTDVVNVRSGASLDATIVGAANRGEIVFILDASTEQADGLTWYRAVTSPGVSGWMAGHAEFDQNITPDAPTTSVEWCATPDRAVFRFADARLPDQASLAGLSLSTALLGVGGSAVLELVWGSQDPVCLSLAITDGRTVAVGISAEIEGCGHPMGGSPVVVTFGSGAVSGDGSVDSRAALVHDALLGYASGGSGLGPNLADVLMMTSVGPADDASGEVCITADVSGPATSPQFQLSAATTQCAELLALTDETARLLHFRGQWDVELRLTEGSFVKEGMTTSFQPQVFRISAKRGIDGSAGLSSRTQDDC